MRIIPIFDAAPPSLAPDLLFDGVMADFALADADEAHNRGGLRAKESLLTAVLICLLSDARAEPHEMRDGDDNRGWPGDSFDLAQGETNIGSKLWLLRRRALGAETERIAEDYALASLRPLIDQSAAAAASATATADPARNRLDLAITLTDRDGAVLVSQQFRVLWDELDRVRSAHA